MESTSDWRKEVASRVESYRVRRKRPPRERSLPLDFGQPLHPWADSEYDQPAEGRPVAGISETPEEAPPFSEARVWLDEPIYSQLSQEALPEPEPRLTESKVIEFPRSALCPTVCDELAEPVLNRPRILDVPEGVGAAPAPLSNIGLDAPEDTEPPEEHALELPLEVAPVRLRVLAGMVDALVVGTAAAMFLTIALNISVSIPNNKLGLAAALGLPCILWGLYHYVFLVYGGVTAGMRVLRLQLATFERERPSRAIRRVRACGMMCSCLPLGLGLAWAIFDEDSLCWHDRISRTYLVSQQEARETGLYRSE